MPKKRDAHKAQTFKNKKGDVRTANSPAQAVQLIFDGYVEVESVDPSDAKPAAARAAGVQNPA